MDKLKSTVIDSVNEKGKDSFQEVIAARYDHLLEEREKLAVLSEKPKSLAIAQKVSLIFDDERTEELREHWLNNVKEQTEWLDLFGDVSLFTSDLAEQPAFPDTEITFDSDSARKYNLLHPDLLGGYRAPQDIHIVPPVPLLRNQLASVLHSATLDMPSQILAHELLHEYHRSERNGMSAEATEAQAWFQNIIGGNGFSLQKVLSRLSSPDGYDFDTDISAQLLLSTAYLYGAGYSTKQVAHVLMNNPDLFRSSSVEDSDVRVRILSVMRKAFPLNSTPDFSEEDSLAEVRIRRPDNTVEDIDDYVFEGIADIELDSAGSDKLAVTDIEHENLQVLLDLFLLHIRNEAKKAQLALVYSIDHIVSDKELKERLGETLHANIFCPRYKLHGEEIDAASRLQRIIIPSDYPYDRDGQRKAIIFGCQLEEGNPEYSIGIWDATPDDAVITVADTDVEREKLYDKVAAQLEFFSEEALTSFAGTLLTFIPRVSGDIKVLHSLLTSAFTEEQRITLLRHEADHVQQTLDVVKNPILEQSAMKTLSPLLSPEEEMMTAKWYFFFLQTRLWYAALDIELNEVFDRKTVDLFTSLEEAVEPLLSGKGVNPDVRAAKENFERRLQALNK